MKNQMNAKHLWWINIKTLEKSRVSISGFPFDCRPHHCLTLGETPYIANPIFIYNFDISFMMDFFGTHFSVFKNNALRASPVLQWLRLYTFNLGGMGLIPGWGTKILHAMGCGWKKIIIMHFIYNFAPKADAYLPYPDPASQYLNTFYPWIPTSVVTFGLCSSSWAWRCYHLPQDFQDPSSHWTLHHNRVYVLLDIQSWGKQTLSMHITNTGPQIPYEQQTNLKILLAQHIFLSIHGWKCKHTMD